MSDMISHPLRHFKLKNLANPRRWAKDGTHEYRPISAEWPSTGHPLYVHFTSSFMLNDCLKIFVISVSWTKFCSYLKTTRSMCSRTCLRTFSCSRTRTKHEPFFFIFANKKRTITKTKKVCVFSYLLVEV